MARPPVPPGVVTDLLAAWAGGDLAAQHRLIEVVYADLRDVAANQLRGREYLSLQPTALVNELYLRLAAQRHVSYRNRDHFFKITARLMRRVLVDHIRRRNALKRQVRVVLAPAAAAVGSVPEAEVLALDEALDELAALDPRQAQIVEMRFFAGLSVEEAAAALHVSAATVKREWRSARAWLRLRLQGAAEAS